MLLINYLVLSTFCCAAAGYYLYRFLRIPYHARPSDNGNNEGGWNDEAGLPQIDMPPGSSMDEWLTDKLNNRDVPQKGSKIRKN